MASTTSWRPRNGAGRSCEETWVWGMGGTAGASARGLPDAVTHRQRRRLSTWHRWEPNLPEEVTTWPREHDSPRSEGSGRRRGASPTSNRRKTACSTSWSRARSCARPSLHPRLRGQETVPRRHRSRVTERRLLLTDTVGTDGTVVVTDATRRAPGTSIAPRPIPFHDQRAARSTATPSTSLGCGRSSTRSMAVRRMQRDGRDERRGGAAVGLTPRRLHHRPDEGADRLVLAGDELLPRRRVGGDGVVDEALRAPTRPSPRTPWPRRSPPDRRRRRRPARRAPAWPGSPSAARRSPCVVSAARSAGGTAGDGPCSAKASLTCTRARAASPPAAPTAST